MKHKWVEPHRVETSEGYEVQGPCQKGYIEVNLECGTMLNFDRDDLEMMLDRIDEAFNGEEL